MPLSDEIIAALLPPGLPPAWEPGTPAERAKSEALLATPRAERLRLRAYLWQKQVDSILRENLPWAADVLTRRGADDPFIEFAVGFIEIDRFFAGAPALAGPGREYGYIFGAVLFNHEFSFGPGLEPRFLASADFGEIFSSLKGVPLLQLPVAETAHAAPDPANATAACWAALRTDNHVSHVVTAKHAIAGLRRGQAVAFRGLSHGQLIDFCDSSVDAALITAPVFPAMASSLAVEDEPAIGDDIEFTGTQSGTHIGKITKTHVFADDPNPYDPQRVYIDVHGVPGDSGALLRLRGSGAAAGIYTGTKTGKSTVIGQSQYMKQAVELMKIDLYE